MLARRDLLRVGLGLGLIGASGVALRQLLWPPALAESERHGLLALGESLLPAAGLDGGALAVLIAGLAAQTDADRALRRVIRRGLHWLDGESKGEGGFSSLPRDARHTLLERAVAQAPGSVPRVLLDRLRMELFALYYARPETLAALGLPPPPQPAGYLDYQRAP